MREEPQPKATKQAGGHMLSLTAFPVPLSLPKMDVTRLLLASLIVCLCFLAAYSHLAPEEKPKDDRSLRGNSSMNLLDSPSVSIVGK